MGFAAFALNSHCSAGQTSLNALCNRGKKRIRKDPHTFLSGRGKKVYCISLETTPEVRETHFTTHINLQLVLILHETAVKKMLFYQNEARRLFFPEKCKTNRTC